MRFGFWRGTPLAIALGTALTLGLSLSSNATADGLLGPHVMPGYAPAYDFTTGQQYQAPPIPYGHYAKDPMADLRRAMGSHGGGLFGGLGHSGSKCSDGNCASTGGCGHGWFGKGHGSPCSEGVGCGFLGKHKCKSGCDSVMATAQAPSAQAIVSPSGQSACGQPGCTIGAKHGHLGKMLSKMSCGSCGGRGCGECGAPAYENAGPRGCGLCGGRGCPSCLSGLKDSLRGKLAGMFHKPKIQWFLGAGGPVPITPGYVPYIVTTRSPREFFAFAPMNPNAP